MSVANDPSHASSRTCAKQKFALSADFIQPITDFILSCNGLLFVERSSELMLSARLSQMMEPQ